MPRCSWIVAASPLACIHLACVHVAPDAPADAGGPGVDHDASHQTGPHDASSPDAGSTIDPEDAGLIHGEGAIEVHFRTLLTDDGQLAFASNLPPNVEDCADLRVDVACDDADDDGLTDAWEDAVLDRLRPMRRMDEDESLFDDSTAVIADVGRVVAVDEHYRLFVMLGYSRDYGRCALTAHNGDSERVALNLARYPEGGAGGVVVVGAYTAAHEGTSTDHSRVFVGLGLSHLVFDADPTRGDEPRWVVYPSQDKHATYATIEICEGISPIPCLNEDCAPDGVRTPSEFDLLPAVVNAGEEHAPRADDLTVVGFPGESAWADRPFCGGRGGTSCSSPVREKLLVDPF